MRRLLDRRQLATIHLVRRRVGAIQLRGLHAVRGRQRAQALAAQHGDGGVPLALADVLQHRHKHRVALAEDPGEQHRLSAERLVPDGRLEGEAAVEERVGLRLRRGLEVHRRQLRKVAGEDDLQAAPGQGVEAALSADLPHRLLRVLQKLGRDHADLVHNQRLQRANPLPHRLCKHLPEIAHALNLADACSRMRPRTAPASPRRSARKANSWLRASSLSRSR